MNDELSKLYSSDNLSPLSRVTLVIPTYNRNFYLSRCLWYHAHFPFAEIIVADSSSQDKRVINKKTIHDLSQLSKTKITYLEYNFPPEEYGGEIYRKLGDAIHHVSTEYSLSCTDKEFLIPTTVANAVLFLDKNSDYSLADGVYYLMSSKKEITHWQGDKSIIENSPLERLKILTKYVSSTQFALHRTDGYNLIFENMSQYDLFDIRFGETLIETFPFLNGKLNRSLDTIMSIRDNTEHHKQNNIINYITHNLEKSKAESSYSRYKRYADYPYERRDVLLYKYKLCIENNIKINENCSFYNDILNARYSPNIIKFSNPRLINIYYLFWGCLIPEKLKYILSHLFGVGQVGKKIIPSNEPANIKYIFNLIEETKQYIPADIPIKQMPIFQGERK